ncbi:Hypothetical protein R9X50_00195800 [Acrodontium crateriforme]|uniref:Uncharacterized protein n=1 Tax=Acrodontium crateriforme TaxID=150365 RepID=A0AAQ3M0M1_9PEZI|nr:Hypothetical protein R9X50_00195800 [Acrodontium crateriforme]
MGNCCGKESPNFAGEGRTLAATPAQAPPQTSNPRAGLPKTTSPGRTLGTASDQNNDPKAAAARAAEERMKASQGKGKLGKQLDAQKAQTYGTTLAENARDNVAHRDAQAATQARNYN